MHRSGAPLRGGAELEGVLAAVSLARPRPARRAAVLAVTALLALGSSARADWLVTRDGHQIETRGAWEVRGAIVVFRLPDGTLSSLNLSQVDLAASAELNLDPATRAVLRFLRRHRIEIADEATLRWTVAALVLGSRPPPAAASRPRAPVLVLTDADVGHIDPAELAASLEGPAEEQVSLGGDGTGPEVVSWEQSHDPELNGIRIRGTVRNAGKDPSVSVSVTVVLLDENAAMVGTGKSNLSVRALGPGQSAPFEIVLPGITEFALAEFHVRGRPMPVGGDGPATADMP